MSRFSGKAVSFPHRYTAAVRHTLLIRCDFCLGQLSKRASSTMVKSSRIYDFTSFILASLLFFFLLRHFVSLLTSDRWFTREDLLLARFYERLWPATKTRRKERPPLPRTKNDFFTRRELCQYSRVFSYELSEEEKLSVTRRRLLRYGKRESRVGVDRRIDWFVSDVFIILQANNPRYLFLVT